MKIKAEILQKHYYDDDKMFGVYTARDMGTGIVQNLVGKLPMLIPGELVEGEVTENYRENKFSGETETQWVVKSTLLPSPPTTPDGIRIFLQSGFAYKVGPNVAEKMVSKYGRRTIDILKETELNIEKYLERFVFKDNATGEEISSLDSLLSDGEQTSDALYKIAKDRKTKHLFDPLVKVDGVGARIAANIMAGWINNKAKHELLLFLFTCGLSSAMSGKVIKALGAKAPEVLRENPYKLLHIIPSISFSVPDRVAREHGMEPNDERRLFAMLLHAMNTIVFQFGHTCVPEEFLIKKTMDFVQKTQWIVSEEDIRKACDHLVAANSLTAQIFDGKKYLYTPETISAERKIARGIKTLTREKSHRDLTLKFILSRMSEWEKKSKISLDASQKQALVTCLGSSVSILTGGPGTGKTTIMKCARYILEQAGLTVAECAPTGKAARNMSSGAQTIHRLLGLHMEDQHRGEPVSSDYLFVDESSMMDVFLGAVTMQAITEGSARVVFVGDIDQLPSVGPGTVLHSMIDSGKIPVSRLDTVHRTEKGGVLDFLHFVRNTERGSLSPMSNYPLPSDVTSPSEMCALFSSGRGEDTAQKVLETVRLLVKTGYHQEDIQVLAPMKNGNAGIKNLNRELQQLLNPNAKNPAYCFETLSFGEKILWAPGDRVMNIENDYTNDVFNGEIGYIKSISREMKSITVVYPELNNKTVQYQKDSIDGLLHAYATTIHKSQGSEYKAVVVVFPRESIHMAERALIYTAISRSRKKCVLMGDEDTANTAISTVKSGKRFSLLKERINGDAVIEPWVPQQEIQSEMQV